MKGNWRALLRRFCLESTVLGLKYFYLYPDLLSRCFWCVNIVFALILTGVLNWCLAERFLEMPTRITIENQFEPVKNLPYPSITLCSPNQITNSYAMNLYHSFGARSSEVNMESAMPDLLGFYEVVASVNEDALITLHTLMALKNITVPKLLGNIAQSCDNFLKLCYYEMKSYPNCKGLFLPILTAHGLCCSFNSKYVYNGLINEHTPGAKTWVVGTTGENRGLIVVADYNAEDAFAGTILSGGAIKVLLSDSTEFPSDVEKSVVETDSESFHILNAAYTYCSDEVATLNPFDRKCFFDHEYTLPYFVDYSKSDCDLSCVVKAVLEQCHCVLFYVPDVDPQTSCNITSIPCLMEAKFSSKSMYSCDCLSDCESRQYSSDIIEGNLKALPYMLSTMYDGIQFNKTTSIMNFYFTNAMYVKKKQETVMSLVILISNLGGIFGLCLGWSCVSVLEICFYVYTTIRNHWRRRRFQRSFVQRIQYLN